MKMHENYKALNIGSFSKDLEGYFKSHNTYDCLYFQKVFLKLLNKLNKEKDTPL